jgi:hypothetical protein
MMKKDRKKLTLNRETVRDLTAERLTEAQGGAGKAVTPNQGETTCNSQTLSCTL